MSREEKPNSSRSIAGLQPGDTGDGRKWLTVYNLGFFLVFLGLFNPLLWVSVHAGVDRRIIMINGLYTVLLVAFGITVMLIGRRLAKQKKR